MTARGADTRNAKAALLLVLALERVPLLAGGRGYVVTSLAAYFYPS